MALTHDAVFFFEDAGIVMFWNDLASFVGFDLHAGGLSFDESAEVLTFALFEGFACEVDWQLFCAVAVCWNVEFINDFVVDEFAGDGFEGYAVFGSSGCIASITAMPSHGLPSR